MKEGPSFVAPAYGIYDLGDSLRLIQSRHRAEYLALELFANLIRFFLLDNSDAFRIVYRDVGAARFEWAPEEGFESTFRKWVPGNRLELDKVAQAVSGGFFSIASLAKELDIDPLGTATDNPASRVWECYLVAAAGYDGAPLPAPPKRGSWKKRLEWFCECRDIVGASCLLASLAAGIPYEMVVPEEVPDSHPLRIGFSVPGAAR